MSSGILRRVVWQKLTDVSEVHAASVTIVLEAASTSEMSVNFSHKTGIFD
jgi:hypothetical protein